MSWTKSIVSKYHVKADGPSTGHHNSANITLTEAIDSFMHFLLKKDGATSAAEETATYIAEQKIPDETVRAFARAVSQYSLQIQPKGKEEVPEESEEDTQDAPADDQKLAASVSKGNPKANAEKKTR